MTESFEPVHIVVQILIMVFLTAMSFALMLVHGAKVGARNGGPIARNLLITSGLLVLWFLVVYGLASSGLLRLSVMLIPGVPNLLWAMAVPVGIGLLALRSGKFRAALDAVPMAWLAGFHLLRIPFGFVFLSIYELGQVPAAVAFRGGYGDITAGLLGGLVAYLYLSGAPRKVAILAAVVWNAEGLIDFAVVLPTAIQIIAPNSSFDQFDPFMLIPAFAVPMFILTHIYSIRALMQRKD